MKPKRRKKKKKVIRDSDRESGRGKEEERKAVCNTKEEKSLTLTSFSL
jgi:hypothetical protein